MHHICYEVRDIKIACELLKKRGVKILGTGEPSIGAHGKPVIFLNPNDFDGTLTIFALPDSSPNTNENAKLTGTLDGVI